MVGLSSALVFTKYSYKNLYRSIKKWYNNGIISKQFFENEVPSGWYIGRLKWPKNK